MGREYEDDGRVIADMSGVGKESLSSGYLFPGGDSQGARPGAKSGYESGRWNEHIELDREEKRAAILGMLKSGLLIGCIYLLGFAAVIILLLFLWKGF